MITLPEGKSRAIRKKACRIRLLNTVNQKLNCLTLHNFNLQESSMIFPVSAEGICRTPDFGT